MRDRQTDRDRQRETGRQSKTQRDIQRARDRETDRNTKRVQQRQADRQKEIDSHRDRERESKKKTKKKRQETQGRKHLRCAVALQHGVEGILDDLHRPVNLRLSQVGTHCQTDAENTTTQTDEPIPFPCTPR